LTLRLDAKSARAWELFGLSDIEPAILSSHREKHPDGQMINVDRGTGLSVVVSGDHIRRISLHLPNVSNQPVPAPLPVTQCSHIRDFGPNESVESPIATITADVKPGSSVVDFIPDEPITCTPNAPVMLALDSTESLSWRLTLQEPPGTQAGQWDKELGYWRW